ncbi:MAG TPA: hypothetical protein DGK91_09795 [Clostridium sp.]|jgi:hypothetical protein|nr:hypothetical protein [Clostridium sp.]
MAEQKKKRGRPKGSNNKKKTPVKKKKNPKIVKYEIIDGKKVCPICKTQKGMKCDNYNVKDKKNVCYLVSDFLCVNCNVMMKIETPMSEV